LRKLFATATTPTPIAIFVSTLIITFYIRFNALLRRKQLGQLQNTLTGAAGPDVSI
jgi:hypothetical protein